MKAGHRKCLVLGGRGFVGAAIVQEALERGYQVTIVEKDDYTQHVGTATDLLINANGNSKKFLAAEDPAQEFELSVLSVEKSLHDFRPQQYVYLSSIDVYPVFNDPALNAETSAIDVAQISPYGFHKYLAEQLVRFYSKSWLIFRMGGFVGPRLWKNSIYDLLKHKPLRVHPDSEYQYIHKRDLARIIFEVYEAETHQEIFNIAGDGTIPLRQVAEMVPGYDVAKCPDHLPREKYDINVEKIKKSHPLPRTAITVRNFISDVLSGKETIL